jgi:hypothetical protein
MNNFESNRKMKIYYFILFLLLKLNFLYSQEASDLSSLSRSMETQNDSISKEKTPPINKYLIFDQKGDSTVVDTSLTLKKYYKFNYLRKDNLEKLKFSNFGQSYNSLTYGYEKSSLPFSSFSSKQHAYLKSSEVKYYKVPTPLTELLFKSVMKQGQFTDVLFSTNTSENFNFSISFKGMRSLGNYQNILSGLKKFRFTSNYNSINEKYKFKTHYVSQNFENRENGGLTNSSLDNFESEDNLFSERSKLSVKFEDATSHFLSKRFFLDHQFRVLKSKKNNSLFIGHIFEYETTYNAFEQNNPTPFYGSSATPINDKTQIKTMSNKFYTYLSSKFFGDIKVSYLNYNYNYLTNALSSSELGFNENENSISFELKNNIFNHELRGKLEKNLFGDRLGDLINIVIVSQNKKFNYSLGFNTLNKHPGLYFELFESNYSEIKWANKLNSVKINNINLEFSSRTFGSFNFDYTKIDNFTYFDLKDKSTLNDEQDLKLIPKVNQHSNSINYLKLKWQKEFNFGKFALDNSFIFQNVDQDQNILNLPNYIFRNTIYFSDHVFKRAMFLQTGLTFKYFSNYYANEYNPLISSFHIQNDKKIGNFPMIDVFVNARIKRTRLFLKAEHINSTITGNNFYSTPSYPYRDFIIRFGLIWNFFN